MSNYKNAKIKTGEEFTTGSGCKKTSYTLVYNNLGVYDSDSDHSEKILRAMVAQLSAAVDQHKLIDKLNESVCEYLTGFDERPVTSSDVIAAACSVIKDAESKDARIRELDVKNEWQAAQIKYARERQAAKDARIAELNRKSSRDQLNIAGKHVRIVELEKNTEFLTRDNFEKKLLIDSQIKEIDVLEKQLLKKADCQVGVDMSVDFNKQIANIAKIARAEAKKVVQEHENMKFKSIISPEQIIVNGPIKWSDD